MERKRGTPIYYGSDVVSLQLRECPLCKINRGGGQQQQQQQQQNGPGFSGTADRMV